MYKKSVMIMIIVMMKQVDKVIWRQAVSPPDMDGSVLYLSGGANV